MDVSLRWLLNFIATLYETLPDALNVHLPAKLKRPVKLLRLRAEADEMWSFVFSENQQAVGLDGH